MTRRLSALSDRALDKVRAEDARYCGAVRLAEMVAAILAEP